MKLCCFGAELYRRFVYFTNSLIDELRSPSPDIFTAEPYPRSIVPSFYGDGSVRSSQFDSDVKTPPDASGQFARPVGGASPTWDNSSVASSQQWLAIDTSTVPGRDVEDSPVDKEVETAPMVGRQRSLYQPRRPGMLHVSETQPADSVERDMFEAPASGSSLPSYQTDAFSGSRSTSESKNQDDSMRRLRSTTLTQSLRVLPPIRQASHESSADQSVYSAEQERRFHYSMSSGSDSSSSTSPMSGMQSTRFPMPPESPRTNPPNSVLVDDEPFV